MLGPFKLNENEAWIGPVFIDKRYRGKRIAGPLVNFAMVDQIPIGTQTFYTSLNSRNTLSQRLFVRNGFEIIASTHVQAIGRYQFKRLLLDLNLEETLRERLR
jgi:GNAT superfamily N-acetyltransferase